MAAGDGNFAIACAAEGASVVASDLSPEMVRRGRERSETEGYEIEWVEADAEELPFEDARFDCAGSVFGAMIAPRPRVAAEELFRVVRPGNTVGMTAWTPESRAVELFQIARRHLPSDPEAPSMEEWGREDTVRERFDGLANSVQLERRTLAWSADSPQQFLELMQRHSPPQVAAKEHLDPDAYARLVEQQLEVVRGWAGGHGAFSVEFEYLLIVARRRG